MIDGIAYSKSTFPSITATLSVNCNAPTIHRSRGSTPIVSERKAKVLESIKNSTGKHIQVPYVQEWWKVVNSSSNDPYVRQKASTRNYSGRKAGHILCALIWYRLAFAIRGA